MTKYFFAIDLNKVPRKKENKKRCIKRVKNIRDALTTAPTQHVSVCINSANNTKK